MQEYTETIQNFLGRSHSPLYTRDESGTGTNPENYDIYAAQKALETSRAEAWKKQEQNNILELFSIIPKIASNRRVTTQLSLEKNYLKKKILENAYAKRIGKSEFYMPTYLSLKQSFTAVKQNPQHTCKTYENLAKNAPFFHSEYVHKASGDVFVCIECGKCHFCTQELCDAREINHNNEGQVCKISGKYMGVITAIPDVCKPYSYHIEAGQDTERNQYTEPLLGKRTPDFVIGPPVKRQKRTTFKNLSRESLNPIANNPKSTLKLRKITEGIRTVIRNVMLPNNFNELCSTTIREYTEKGLKKTEELLKSGNYLTSLDLMNVFTFYTRDMIPILTARNCHALVTEEMIGYFTKCVMAIFKIMSSAPNDECVQGAKNLTFTNTVISILYQIKEGISATICVASIQCIEEFCKIDRYPIKFLKTSSDDCGFDPLSGHCTHKSVEFITKHRILDLVLLPLELVNGSNISFSSSQQPHSRTQKLVSLNPSESMSQKSVTGPGKNRFTGATMRAVRAFISIISCDENYKDEESLKKYMLSNNMVLDDAFVQGRIECPEFKCSVPI